jgi:hypothetical protein
MVEGLGRDEPRLAAAENIEGFHAAEGVSKAKCPQLPYPETRVSK